MRDHRDKVLAHAATRLVRSRPLSEPFDISGLFRTFIKLEDKRLKTSLHFGASACQVAQARSFVLDLVVESAYCEAARLGESAGLLSDVDKDCAVVAIGGYGRAELAPYSDLDLLFLHSNYRSAQIRQLIEQVLRLLWDARLTVGHSFRTVSECVAAARADAHFQTSLVNTRLLAGNVALYDSLLSALEKERVKRADSLLSSIRAERDARYAKFSPEVCLQEPNVKDGAGGLRDFHTAIWTAHARYGCCTLEELRARNLISEDRQRAVTRAYDFLWRVRYVAHLLTRRKTERLSLDLQPILAEDFGYKTSAHMLASEKFMRDYYAHARELHLFSQEMDARASEVEPKWTRRFRMPRADNLFEPLSVKDGRLQLEGDARVFLKNPLRMFDAFALAQATELPFSHGLRAGLCQSLKAVDKSMRSSAEASEAFLKLLRRRGRVGHTLRLMHDTGFLSRFLPEFGRISLLIQHDLYHHYTVDEHTLKAIDALDRLHTEQDKQHAHLRLVSDEVEDISLLYLSLLLHDIGKGRGPGHIPRGAKIAERVCRRLRLSCEDAAKVVLLVRLHVAMAHLAQRRDINEPKVVADFAEQLGTPDALNMLLLLTFADLNAVAPGVWSEWKGTLLWELYRRTRTFMTGKDAPLNEAELEARFKEQMVVWLKGEFALSDVERHVALMPDRYLRVMRADAAATHLHMIEELRSGILALRWAQHGSASTELTICAQDRPGLFADIAGTLAAHGIEILSAELNTRDDRVALDVLTLREASTHHAIDVHRYAGIEASLRKAVAGEADIAALVERWRTKNAPRKRAVASYARRSRRLPHVVCDNDSSRSNTLIEVQAPDETGLAYKIARELTALGLNIVCAKIATERSDALDVFYVTDEEGMKLQETAMREVEAILTEKLSQVGST